MGGNLFDWLHGRVRALSSRAGVAVPPPASETAIAETQRVLRRELPPSFARLLRLQDGWPDAWNRINLLSTTAMRGEGTDGWDLLLKRERYWRDREIDPRDSKQIARYKAPARRVVPWRMLIIGLAKDGRILCFDTRRKPDAEGEWPVLYLEADGTVRRRFASFNDFLHAIVNEAMGMPIDEHPSPTTATASASGSSDGVGASASGSPA